MNFDPTLIAAALVTVIGAITGATVTVIVSVTNAKKELLAKASEVSAVAAKKTEEIHALVNGASTLAATRLASLEQKVESLYMELGRAQAGRLEDAKARNQKEAP